MPAQDSLVIARRCSLFLSFAFSVVGFSVGLNALLKASQERSYINRLVVPHGIIDIGVHDVFTTGAVITTICAFLTLLSGVFCASTWCPVRHRASWFRVQSSALLFCAAWLFAALVTYDCFFARRSVQITINLRGLHVPEPVIQRLADLLHFTRAYRDVYFLRLLAVMPWFSFVMAVAAAVVLQFAAGRADADVLAADEKKRRARIAMSQTQACPPFGADSSANRACVRAERDEPV